MDAQERPADGNQVLGMAALAAHPQKAVLETPALELVFELPLNVARQRPVLGRQLGSEGQVVLFDDPVEQGLLGPVALVTDSAQSRAGRPCRGDR